MCKGLNSSIFRHMNNNSKILKNKKGIILVITVSVITILLATTLQVNKEIRSKIEDGASYQDEVVLRNIALSGLEFAKAILTEDANNKETNRVDSLVEKWSNALSYTSCLKFKQGRLTTLTISDESGKIQANALIDKPFGKQFNIKQRALWLKFLKVVLPQKKEKEAINVTEKEIINSIKDWLDANDGDMTTGEEGAEKSYYSGNGLSYFGINSPFAHIDELKKVKGMNKVTAYLGNIEDVITVYGAKKNGKNIYYDGRINLNTAPPLVLKTLMSTRKDAKEDEEKNKCVSGMLSFRQDKENLKSLNYTNWYRQCKGCYSVSLDTSYAKTISDYFKVVSSAELKGRTLSITAILYRKKNKKNNKWDTKLLYLKEK